MEPLNNPQYISAEEYCLHYQADIGFIHRLEQTGLLQVVVIDNTTYLPDEELPALEKFIHLYYDLEINLEGIEAIYHLLNKLNGLQQTIIHLQNQLSDRETVVNAF